MAYRLCRMAGRLDVDQMLEEISPEQMDEWIAYYYTEPWGEEWLQSSLLCSIVANMFVSDRSKALEPDAFVPKLQGTKPKLVPPQPIGEIQREIERRYG